MESAPVLGIQQPSSATRGFSLVEMVIVLAIIAIITVIALTGQSTFNKTLLLTDTAYGVAFSARTAQTFGLSSRTFGSVSNAGYGLHFDRSTPTTYRMFADTSNTLAAPSNCPLGAVGTPERKPGNCRYDTTDGTANTYTFSRGFTIQRFCGKSGLTMYCSDDSGAALTSLDMVFTRPNTSTTINGLLNGTSLITFSCAEITLTDQSGTATKSVRASSLGEISIGQTCP